MAQELKATSSGEIRARDSLLGYWWYEKYEADKVIAELKTACNDKDDWCLHTLKENRHHKYKRCLAMAKWCEYFANYWECCEPPDCVAFIARAKFHRKWHKRWLELAEKFKEGK